MLSDRTAGSGAADIARMNPGAILVNTYGGPIVDKKALIEAVTAGKIVAALDVFDREPLPANPPLRPRVRRGDDAASRLRRAGDLGRLLSADAETRWRSSTAGAGDQSGGAGATRRLGPGARQPPVPPHGLMQAVGDARNIGVLGLISTLRSIRATALGTSSRSERRDVCQASPWARLARGECHPSLGGRPD